MKVFISWSGETSRRLAAVLKTWIHDVIQAVEPYYTPEDIDKGSRWNNEVSGHLEKSEVGILCITRENLNAPWVMFEAGALSKNLERARVCPVLFDVSPVDLQGPLVQFQAAKFGKIEIFRLLQTINSCLEKGALKDESLKRSFDIWWPQLEERVSRILDFKPLSTRIDTRSDRNILDEILHLSRENARKSSVLQTKETGIKSETIIDLLDAWGHFLEAADSLDIIRPGYKQLEELRLSINRFLIQNPINEKIKILNIFEKACEPIDALDPRGRFQLDTAPDLYGSE